MFSVEFLCEGCIYTQNTCCGPYFLFENPYAHKQAYVASGKQQNNSDSAWKLVGDLNYPLNLTLFMSLYKLEFSNTLQDLVVNYLILLRVIVYEGPETNSYYLTRNATDLKYFAGYELLAYFDMCVLSNRAYYKR